MNKILMGWIAAANMFCTCVFDALAGELITFDVNPSEQIFAYNPTTFHVESFELTFSPNEPYLPNGPVPFAWLSAGGICGGFCASNGSVAYYSFNSSQLTVRPSDGSLFTLGSIEAAQTYMERAGGLVLHIVGTYEDGSTIVTTILADQAHSNSFQIYTMPSSFTNLRSVNFAGAPGLSAWPQNEFAIDNIQIEVLGNQPVSEPLTTALALMGVLMAFSTRGRRSQFAQLSSN